MSRELIVPGLALLALLLVLTLWLRLRAVRRESRAMRGNLQEIFERTRRLERIEAAAEERERIYSDLHDDIGAKLLDLIYSAEKPEQADLARSVLQDLRDVVSRSRGAPGSLLEILGEIRAEAEHRLSRVDVALLWEQVDELPDPPLDRAQSLHLFRIVREAVTNAIRHAHAQRLRIRVGRSARELLLDITDDGSGPSASPGTGAGTGNMRARAAELQGSIRWGTGTLGGTKVALRFPLPNE